MSKTIENLKSGNYEVVDNQGVSVTQHFTQCLEKEFANLETKLAESERQYQEYRQVVEKDIEKEIDERIRDTIKEFNLDISQLKQQLAEKEKEIEDVTITHLNMLRYFIRHNSKQGIIFSDDLEKEIQEIEQGKKIWQTKNFTQDKISFCIDKLEKVKELCREKFNWLENSEWEGDIYDKTDVSNAYFDIEANIEEQIKQLKEGN